MAFRVSKPNHVKENLHRLLSSRGKSVIIENITEAVKEKYQVLSPDGLPINGEWYKTVDDAVVAAKKFVQQFANQGYYSSNHGRIALSHLLFNMGIIDDKGNQIDNSISGLTNTPVNTKSSNADFMQVVDNLLADIGDVEMNPTDYIDYDNNKILIDDLLDDVVIDKSVRDTFVKTYPKFVITRREFGKSNNENINLDETSDDNSSDIQQIAAKIADMTDRNDHNGAVLTLAKFLKNKKYTTIMQYIIDIHKLEGRMPYSLIQYRTEILSQLFGLVNKKYGEDVSFTFHQSF